MSSRVAAVLFMMLTMVDPVVAQDDHVALVKTVSGNVKVVRDNSDQVLEAGTKLFKSDKVVSSKSSWSGIVFKDGTLLTVGPSTELEIRNFLFEPQESKYAFAVYLAKGTALYSSGRIGKLSPQSVDVSTPKATVGVRGTRFIVTAE